MRGKVLCTLGEGDGSWHPLRSGCVINILICNLSHHLSSPKPHLAGIPTHSLHMVVFTAKLICWYLSLLGCLKLSSGSCVPFSVLYLSIISKRQHVANIKSTEHNSRGHSKINDSHTQWVKHTQISEIWIWFTDIESEMCRSVIVQRDNVIRDNGDDVC